jgi:hypothetical protein
MIPRELPQLPGPPPKRARAAKLPGEHKAQPQWENHKKAQPAAAVAQAVPEAWDADTPPPPDAKAARGIVEPSKALPRTAVQAAAKLLAEFGATICIRAFDLALAEGAAGIAGSGAADVADGVRLVQMRERWSA